MQTHHHRTHHHWGTLGLFGMVLLALALILALPARASAAPHRNHGLTIAVTPNPIVAGQGVLIYGKLVGPDSAHQRILLFHRINPAQRFTLVSVSHTDAAGFYEFIRADGVVTSNRNWFVLGPDATHSRTVHEWASSVIGLNASAASATTTQSVSFSGTVFPAHRGQRVLLQKQDSVNGNVWHTIAVGYTNAQSGFSFSRRFLEAGSYTLRAFFPSDPRNIAGQSASVSLTVQQQQNPSFTINGSSPAVTDGQPETISGTLYTAGSTTTVQPNVSVTLYAKQPFGRFQAVTTMLTNSLGQYSFTEMPLHNTFYRVQTSGSPAAQTAPLFTGVQDVVTASVESSSVATGDAVKVTGTVTPAHDGHVIYLQEQDHAGQWVDVASGYLSPASTFTLAYAPGETGALNLRVQITGGPWNIGGVSATMPVTVSGAAPVSSLPPAT